MTNQIEFYTESDRLSSGFKNTSYVYVEYMYCLQGEVVTLFSY